MEPRTGPRHRFSRQQLGRPGGGGPDRISALPDDLLLLVLAGLHCTRAAARTGVLSRRWRGLWARLHQIVFRDVAFDSIEAALGYFSPAVSLLEIHVPASTRRWSTDMVDTASVNSLLRAAARLESEEIFLDLSSALIGDSSVVFPALETLYLGSCIDALDSLLSSCPRLHTLHLSGTVKRTHSIYIVAPLLKQLTMSFTTSKISIIFVLAPMVKKVSWKCCYSYGIHAVFVIWSLQQVTLQTAERQGQLPSLHIHASANSPAFIDEADNVAQEVEKHMVAAFSVLELHLTTEGHAFGALVFHLLEMDRIRTSIQRLKFVLRGTVEEGCPPNCKCEVPTNWRSETISLIALEEVEISGFEGMDHEFDLLKSIVRCAPLLQRIIVKLSHEGSTNNDVSAKVYNMFGAYSSVECCVYHSSEIYAKW
ncbi:hypothetical protein VPH35_140384 [Triticum aestivum]